MLLGFLHKALNTLRGSVAKGGVARPYKLYDTASFYGEYRRGLIEPTVGDVVMDRLSDAIVKGERKFIVYDDEMRLILSETHVRDEFERMLGKAVKLNNDGLELERIGDVSGAMAKYEENILPNSFFTLNPYRRLCVLYRRAGDYDNEIRVIRACLARPELRESGDDKGRAFFEDRLGKAIYYREKQHNKNKGS